MGRNRKQGFDYFPCDNDFYDDVKILRLLKFHAHGVYVYHYLLCQIYKQGYYIEYNDDVAFLVSDKFNISEDDVREIVEFCLKVGLFNPDVYQEAKVLTSHGIQSRFIEISNRTKRIINIEKYKLISSEEIGGNKGKNIISSEEIGGNDTKNDISSDFLYNIKDKEKNIYSSYEEVYTKKDEHPVGCSASNEVETITTPKKVKPEYELVVNLWHEVCTNYPTITKLTEKRRQKIDQRMKELDMDYSKLRIVFEKMQASSFMRSGNWASFDWVFMSEGNMTKVLEGNYDDRESCKKTFQEKNKSVNDLWMT